MEKNQLSNGDKAEEDLLIHPREQVKSSQGCNKRRNISRSFPWRHYFTGGQTVRCVWDWNGIILAIQIAILGVTSVTEIRPEAMYSPCILRE